MESPDRPSTPQSLQKQASQRSILSKQKSWRPVEKTTTSSPRGTLLSVTTLASSKHTKHVLTMESVQTWARHLLSGTVKEAHAAVAEMHAILSANDASAVDFLIAHGCVSALVHFVVRDTALSETARSLQTLFRFFVFAMTQRENAPNVLDRVASSLAYGRVVLERRNALRVFLSFAYAQPYPPGARAPPSLLTQIHGYLGDLVRDLWSPQAPENVLESLETMVMVANVPAYREALAHVLSTVTVEKRRQSVSENENQEPQLRRKRRSSSLLTELVSQRRPSSLLESGLGFLKRLVSGSHEAPDVVRNGVHGLVQLIAKGSDVHRTQVALVLEPFFQEPSDEAQKSVNRCGALLCVALVGVIKNPHGDDGQKVRVMLVTEKLVRSSMARRHLHNASISPELYLIANLGSSRCRDVAERLLNELMEHPDFHEYVKPTT
ncbi:hypothetical protein SPRG_01249 [Saprolegnia parasitica CBS 223.65]|uniref:TOG domain-containing protein n=1 Tax=Saprolegnia parasitica (strain CBS 223.65) TaxID=695850 RepID=A0A067CTX0_SAPPC|nr:hypothetical protein SPRG_01249 [Saprolegnia parasitica CBS 223.65]KDO33973.1 hypothetical protein SPRG_01249 [Saprolegnia parasitica CBS 223.65]|eukprot:XP_012194863.1 hypothetical protein SPRG_01249 [Saprolegnia parasitica CBS 223.65]